MACVEMDWGFIIFVRIMYKVVLHYLYQFVATASRFKSFGDSYTHALMRLDTMPPDES